MIGLLQRQFDHLATHLVRNAVPHVFWFGRLILQARLAALQIPIIPTIERGAWDAKFGERQAGRQVAFFDQPDDL